MSKRTKIEKLEELVKGSIDGEITEQTVGSLVPPGENFGSVIYRVDFKVRNGEKEETYYAVAKCTPPNPVAQKRFNIQVSTKAEIAWYTTVIPTIRDFQREHGVEQVADFFQNFFGARISLDRKSDVVDLDAVILTQNLQPLGYKNMDRHIGFDLKVSKAILRDLATFHAVPLAIKLENNELFNKNIRPFLPGFKPPENLSIDNKIKNMVLKDLEDILEIAPYMNRVSKRFNPVSRHELQVRKPWGSISHNDFWVNNIMVKEGENIKTVLLDFQVAKYGTIASDLLFFLLVSVAQETITEHMDELINYYWSEFLKNLKQLNIDISIFAFENFLKEIDESATSSEFSHAMFFILTTRLDKGHTKFDSSNENFEKKDLQEIKITLNDKHKRRYEWVILESVKRGWI